MILIYEGNNKNNNNQYRQSVGYTEQGTKSTI